MGYAPDIMPPQAVMNPEDILTWAQIVYYLAGALAAAAASYIGIRKFRDVMRRRKKAIYEREGENA